MERRQWEAPLLELFWILPHVSLPLTDFDLHSVTVITSMEAFSKLHGSFERIIESRSGAVHAPVTPDTQEVEAGGLLKSRSSRSAWAT
jgi:hypothetical protein